MNAPARSSVFQDVASAIGRESARKLVEAFGGQRIFVPKAVGRDHAIAKAIGLEAARQLSTYYHGTSLALPVSGARIEAERQSLFQRVKKLRAEKKTHQQIAGITGYSERQIYRILDEKPDDTRQGRLFDDGDEG